LPETERLGAIGETEPLETRQRKDGSVQLSSLDLLHSCRDIAAEREGHEVRANRSQRCCAAYARGANPGTHRKVIEPHPPLGDERVTRILSFRDGR
jgi:hypothetical protein